MKEYCKKCADFKELKHVRKIVMEGAWTITEGICSQCDSRMFVKIGGFYMHKVVSKSDEVIVVT